MIFAVIRRSVQRVDGAHLGSSRPRNAAPLEEMSQWRRADGNTVSDFIASRLEPHTSRSKDERGTARAARPMSAIKLMLFKHILVK